jgi:hypothetical protein
MTFPGYLAVVVGAELIKVEGGGNRQQCFVIDAINVATGVLVIFLGPLKFFLQSGSPAQHYWEQAYIGGNQGKATKNDEHADSTELKSIKTASVQGGKI